jgi:replicative DNA helicase
MTIQELLRERLGNMNQPKLKVLSGIHYFDTHEGGFNRGELCIIAARPNVGKTAYARNIALTQLHKGLKPGFFSAEMSRDQILDYIVCTEANENKIHFENSWLNEQGKENVIKSMEWLYEQGFYLDDTRCIEIEDLKRKARVMKSKFNIDSLFIDYLQELSYSTTKYMTEYEKLTKICIDLSKLSAELKIPIFLLSQLNRDSADGRPKLSDLKGSGKIEEVADRVILLEEVKQGNDDNVTYLDCHVDKNRYGKKFFTYRNYFVKNISKITDMKQVLTRGEK